jgi:futalosine hydrolase
MILLVCAVARELEWWVPRSGVIMMIGGVGPVESACAVTGALAQRRYSLVVNAGLCGAFDDAAHIGDGVVVTDETFALDLEDGTPIRLPGGERIIDRAHSDPALVARLASRGFAVLHGVTVARVTATEDTARRLARLGAQVESMEGFAVLRASERAGVPAVEVRGVSNRVGERARSGWDFAAGAAGLARVLDALLDAAGAASGHSA